LIGDQVKLNDTRSEVSARGRTVFLPPLEFAMLKLVIHAPDGISPAAIFNLQYQLDPNGGPTLGPRIVHQRRCQINRKLQPLRLAIVPHKRGAGSVYELRDSPIININQETQNAEGS
jgi:hypothetical protein